MSDLYGEDILLWSERQSELLRRVAAGERVSDHDLDWPNIIEEIESVGRSDLHALEGLLFQALLHQLKAQAWPDCVYVAGWRGEARGFLAQSRRRFAPSMRQRVDLPGLYEDALQAIPEDIDGIAPLFPPPSCPTTMDELLRQPG